MSSSSKRPPRLAILVPCLNEEKGVAAVVEEYREAFPSARIMVVDNGSADRTAEKARAAGAEVVSEPRRGKARAVVTAFELLDDDLVMMVDGDGSYPVEGARRLIRTWEADPVDMVTGIRVAESEGPAFRPFHQVGSSAFAHVFRLVFGIMPGDLFSGLRLFRRRFYKNVPVLFRGFELETELTVQAVDKGFRLAEADVPFGPRAQGTSSKLRTFRDGLRILRLLFVLFRDYRPLAFFGSLSFAFFAAGLLAGSLPIYEYIQTRWVGRFPLAVLAAALMNLSLFSLLTGVMLQSSLRHRRESYQVELRRYGD